jgi:lysophospholipase L1-like esterase
LEKAYGNTVTISNFAEPSTTAKGGLDKISRVTAQKPDLVIIAFGMNDVAGHQPAQYAAQIKGMIDAVRAGAPDAEFIIVASILANPEWNWSPAPEFPRYRDAILALRGPGIAVADMTSLWTDIIKSKRYLDLTGNGINHPNDFGHRLYAAVMMGMLVR